MIQETRKVIFCTRGRVPMKTIRACSPNKGYGLLRLKTKIQCRINLRSKKPRTTRVSSMKKDLVGLVKLLGILQVLKQRSFTYCSKEEPSTSLSISANNMGQVKAGKELDVYNHHSHITISLQYPSTLAVMMLLKFIVV